MASLFDIEAFRDYCLSKKGVTEEFPFGPDTLVYKVMGKMFALSGLDEIGFSMNLKYNTEHIDELRDKYPAVQPGYHMHKRHWNTVMVDGSIPVKELKSLIDHSYSLVVDSLPKKLQAELNALK
ncbi:MAG TPA: MmcQ/YjbR family DNA-binding protein [Chitinophagales bacterium]|nr:MmcQ/YjbR family DNA-binding protein [Chitinophagales bacterium]HMX03652.1 MmcQ/YjbR family DNA-binding protein [Chitinophagales bacterium]HMZ87943.1 MmcQ/YjbR family DNA-binding protein [Chitinophagales bacterium]HNA56741.1 MmcQ/YjbR family DNA-binding protein [Chitinophagales bacterium]HNE44750.1 MmcQ/YjbR family DNA-binding protein [Chitinophagales bacterium]